MRLEGAEWLDGFALLDEAVVPELAEDVLGDLGLVRGRGAVEDIEVDAEPVVDGFVDGVILGAQSLRSEAFFESLGFCGGAVLVL